MPPPPYQSPTYARQPLVPATGTGTQCAAGADLDEFDDLDNYAGNGAEAVLLSETPPLSETPGAPAPLAAVSPGGSDEAVHARLSAAVCGVDDSHDGVDGGTDEMRSRSREDECCSEAGSEAGVLVGALRPWASTRPMDAELTTAKRVRDLSTAWALTAWALSEPTSPQQGRNGPSVGLPATPRQTPSQTPSQTPAQTPAQSPAATRASRGRTPIEREVRSAIKARREAVSGELASPSPPQPPRSGSLFGELMAEVETPHEAAVPCRLPAPLCEAIASQGPLEGRARSLRALREAQLFAAAEADAADEGSPTWAGLLVAQVVGARPSPMAPCAALLHEAEGTAAEATLHQAARDAGPAAKLAPVDEPSRSMPPPPPRAPCAPRASRAASNPASNPSSGPASDPAANPAANSNLASRPASRELSY